MHFNLCFLLFSKHIEAYFQTSTEVDLFFSNERALKINKHLKHLLIPLQQTSARSINSINTKHGYEGCIV